jgi:CheY-like chemotaxis protein
MVDIAVIDGSEALRTVMEEVLQGEGWSTVAGSTVDFKRGRRDLATFLSMHDPQVIVWDIAPPYAENWAYYQTVRTLPSAKERPFILTSTNVPVLTQLLGRGPLGELTAGGRLEILGKPFELERLTAAVHRATAVAGDVASQGKGYALTGLRNGPL